MGLQFGQGLSVDRKSLKHTHTHHTHRNRPKVFHEVGKHNHEKRFFLFVLFSLSIIYLIICHTHIGYVVHAHTSLWYLMKATPKQKTMWRASQWGPLYLGNKNEPICKLGSKIRRHYSAISDDCGFHRYVDERFLLLTLVTRKSTPSSPKPNARIFMP